MAARSVTHTTTPARDSNSPMDKSNECLGSFYAEENIIDPAPINADSNLPGNVHSGNPGVTCDINNLLEEQYDRSMTAKDTTDSVLVKDENNSLTSERFTKIFAAQGIAHDRVSEHSKFKAVPASLSSKPDSVHMHGKPEVNSDATSQRIVKICDIKMAPGSVSKKSSQKQTKAFSTSPFQNNALIKFMRQASSRPIAVSGSSGSRINIVTESCSFIPSTIASSFSLEETASPAPERKSSEARKLGDLGEAAQVSTSCQEKLDTLEDSAYTDTVQSTDSTASLLRRTFSLPHDYHYNKNKVMHAREIFVDFYPDYAGSVVYSSNNSEGFTENEQGFRQTMEDLLEKPEYVDSLESTSSRRQLLAKAALEYAKDRYKLETCREVDEDEASVELMKKAYMKNLAILSCCYMCLFTAMLSMRNLQSSIYNEMGLMALCVLYASLFISCIFTTTIVQRLRPRNTMLLCFTCMGIYVASNFFPHYYVLVPASALAGFAMANSYTAQATYLTNIAMGYATVSGKSFPYVLTRFNGLYYMFFQLAQIIGGIISSVVLTLGDNSSTIQPEVTSSSYTNWTNNTSGSYLNFAMRQTANISRELTAVLDSESAVVMTCGASYCPHLFEQKGGASSTLNYTSLYTLVAIFSACAVFATLLLWLCLDPLEGEMKARHSCVSHQLAACFKFFFDVRVVCLLPLMFYSLLQVSFMFGEFSKAFVTCSSGVHMLGYVMLTISCFCATSSYLNSRIAKHVSRRILIPIGYAIHVSLYIVMLLWTPTSSNVYVLFIIAGIWGLADGIFVTQVVSLFGVLFMDNKEPAFAGLKMCQALAVCLFFFVSPHLCTSVKIIGMIVIAVLAALGYSLLEVILQRQQKTSNNPRTILTKIGPTSV